MTFRLAAHLTVDEFRTVMPKFADTQKYPDELVEQWIDFARTSFNPCIWGSKMKLGETWFVAHWLSTETTNGNGGGLAAFATSKKVGDVSVSYSDTVATAGLNNPYMLTPYGRQYWFMLQNLSSIGLAIV